MIHTILLVDDHPVFRNGLRYLLEDEEDMQIVGEAGDGESALDRIAELSPHIVVMDVSMPGMSGIETTRRIAAEFPQTFVVALSIHAEMQFVKQMLQAGAAGYILKESAPEELVKGIRCVMLGDGYLSPAITGIVVSQFIKSVPPEQHNEKMIPLIRETKFDLPPLPGDYMDRPRLINQLEQNRKHPIQIVIAPAGYGKTTLVSSWIREHEWPGTWLSLSANDSDLRRFIFCFVRAVRKIFPDVLEKVVALLTVDALPPIQVLVTALINEINLIEQHFLLVFDNYHVISEKSVNDFMAELFRHPTRVMHLVIVSRTDPFLPITAMRAQGMLAEIRMKNLQFTDEETTKFLQSTLRQDISESISLAWNRNMEGWVTGLKLAALFRFHKSDADTGLQDSIENCHYVKEYLYNEILSKQPEYIRSRILRLSILKRFCAPLIESLCSYPVEMKGKSGWDVIKWLKSNHLFLVALDTEGYWFRFHYMFQDLIQGQLKRQFSPDEISELHLKAGNWFAANGHREEATFHFQARAAFEEIEEAETQFESSPQLQPEGWTLSFDSPERLTGREQEILAQLVQGKTNKEIGEELFISIDTVKSHLKSIFQKLGVASRLQAVTKARELKFPG